MKKMIQITPLLTVALLLSGGGSLVSGATIVTQYQYNPNGDWFAEPSQPPNPPGGDFNLVPYTTNAGHAAVNNMYNYASAVPIQDGSFGALGPSGFSGPGLDYIIQSRNTPIDGTNGSQLILRDAAGRLTLRTQGVANSDGMSLLAWSSAPNTMLHGVDFLLSIGPSSGGGGPADYTDGGMRVAVQDTNDNWFLSNWSSNGKAPVDWTDPTIAGTLSGLHVINLTTETWAPFTPATTGSGNLIEFNAGQTFAAFSGEAKAFGYYVQKTSAGGFRMRMNGFQVLANPVTVPEPSSAMLLSISGIVAAGLRRRRA